MMKQAFPSIVEPDFTANVESLLDMVEEGKVSWKTVVSNFYPDLEEAVKKADCLLDRMGIAEMKHKYPSQISGGQKQRVAIARALVADPKIILTDEPTGALDADTAEEIMQIFQEIHAQGKTVVIVTHDDKIAAKTNRLIRLEKGTIVEDKPLAGERGTL